MQRKILEILYISDSAKSSPLNRKLTKEYLKSDSVSNEHKMWSEFGECIHFFRLCWTLKWEN